MSEGKAVSGVLKDGGDNAHAVGEGRIRHCQEWNGVTPHGKKDDMAENNSDDKRFRHRRTKGILIANWH